MSSKEHCRFAAVAGSPGAGIVVDSSGSSIAVHESPITPPHLEEAAPAYSRKDLLAARYRVARVLPYQQASPPFISNLALAVFSGLLLVFAFPDWNLWSLGWVGTAPLIMALVRERRFWRGLALGWTTGIIFFAGTSYWVTYSMHHYGGVPLGLSYALMMVLAAILSSFTGLFAGVFGLAVKRLGGWAIISAPILWAASEYARILVTGVGWNALGYSQAFQPAVIQVSSWGGVYLVTAIMVFAATALVFGMVYLELRRGLLVLTVAGLIAVLSVLYGESLRPTAEGPHSINALAVQPVIPIEGDWEDRRFFDQMFERQRDMSTQTIQSQASANDVAAEQKKIDVVIWPESPINFQYDRDTQLRKEIESFAIEYKVYVLFNSWGFPQNNESADAVYNSAIVVDPSGQKTSEYDKLALVPFGEYVPARGIIPFIDRIPALVADVTAGSK
ncbi:MAG TPA: apolipoprotein N-acyltransferase, partial [Blastocatellia bacterium]|nr:apolipoprotein N-acyltransferase [Blastocatellia bacterium]